MKYLAVVLNAPEPQQGIVYRDADCKVLFEYGFENYNEIIKIPKTFFNTYFRIIYENKILSILLRYITIITTFIVFIVIFKHKKSKNIKKYTDSKFNNELKLKCLNW